MIMESAKWRESRSRQRNSKIKTEVEKVGHVCRDESKSIKTPSPHACLFPCTQNPFLSLPKNIGNKQLLLVKRGIMVSPLLEIEPLFMSLDTFEE